MRHGLRADLRRLIERIDVFPQGAASPGHINAIKGHVKGAKDVYVVFFKGGSSRVLIPDAEQKRVLDCEHDKEALLVTFHDGPKSVKEDIKREVLAGVRTEEERRELLRRLYENPLFNDVKPRDLVWRMRVRERKR